MDGQRDMRVSDRDREAAVQRLRLAHNEGRLKLDEYDNRITLAYQSVTYGDLADLFADLPAPQPGAVATPVAAVPPAAQRPYRPPSPPSPVTRGDVPGWIKVLWAIWGSVLLINLTVWGLVSLSDFHLEYFWPMWLGVPTIVLGGLSAAATSARRAKLERRARRQLGG